MTTIKRLAYGFGAMVCLMAQGWAEESWMHEETERRIVVANAEDLALTGDGRWVIVSSMPGGAVLQGALYGVAVNDDEVFRLEFEQVASDRRLHTDCDAPVPLGEFSPHGIALQNVEGRETLYVVNHGQRESVEMYDVVADDSLAIHWVGCLELPEGAAANAVAVSTDGRIFVTNMMDLTDKDDEQSRWMGDVLVWAQDAGWQSVPNSRTYAPNGLLVSDDGNELYVASWAGGEVIRLSVAEDHARTTLSLPFLPDNLRWGPDRTILATGLHATAEEVVTCVMAQDACDIAIPTGIASIDTANYSLGCVRELPLHMGTSTIAVGQDFWVGPVRGEQLWVVDRRELDERHCRE